MSELIKYERDGDAVYAAFKNWECKKVGRLVHATGKNWEYKRVGDIKQFTQTGKCSPRRLIREFIKCIEREG